MNDSEQEALGLQDLNDALALVLLVMPSRAGDPVTGNFRAPLVFNLRERTVLQVVNRDEQYHLASPVDLSAYPLPAPPVDESTPSSD
jgi:flagellar assembly factor FliW